MDLFYLLWNGIQSVQNSQPMPLPEYFPDYLAPLYSAQGKLGWDQLLYGQISISWAHYIMYASNGTINETIFYSRTIQTILQFFLNTWTT